MSIASYVWCDETEPRKLHTPLTHPCGGNWQDFILFCGRAILHYHVYNAYIKMCLCIHIYTQMDIYVTPSLSIHLLWTSKSTADGDCSHEIKRRLLLGRKVMTNLDSILKSRDITLPTKVHLVKAMVFPLAMYGCEESWAPKNWCSWTVVLEKTLESPLDCKEIQPVHAEGDESWVFIGRTDAEAETPILWPPHAKSWLIGKDPDAGRDWGKEEKGMIEDEMAGWHHRLDGH